MYQHVTIFLFIVFSFTLSNANSLSSYNTLKFTEDSTEIIKSDLSSMSLKIDNIETSLAIYEIAVVDSLIETFNINVNLINNFLESQNTHSPFQRDLLYKEIKQVFNQLETVDTFHKQIAFKKNTWRVHYHKLWDESFYLKKKADNLYVNTKTEDFHYGGFENVETTNIRKKHIYSAYSAIYKNHIGQLKIIAECDYKSRIVVLNKVITMLHKVNDLFLRKDSKSLEKQLKKIDRTNLPLMEKLILEY